MSKFLLFKKVPKNEIGTGTEIAILKKYFDDNYIDDPKNIKINDGARFYPISVIYDNNEFNYEIKAYETKEYSKDRRLIVNSNDPIWQNRKENDFLVWESDDKITENSKVKIYIIKTDSPLYGEINSVYKSSNGLVLNEGDTLFRKFINQFNRFPLNQILYGPPGTGKTYTTIKKSLEILGLETGDPTENAEIFRSQLNHRIFFATMHPSYSYEDFVQGLKPKTNEVGELIFKQKDGIFKKVADLANEVLINDGIEVSNVSYTNEEILKIAFFLSKFNSKPENNANLYFGDKSYGKVYAKISEKTKINPNTIKNYRDRFDFLASTERQGWVPKNGSTDRLDNTEQFPYNDIYNELKDKSFDEVKQIVDEIWNRTTTNQIETTSENQNYVLILDEINRANISKVFGELITLIEEDKRIGGENEMSLMLSSGEEFSVPSNLYIIGTMNTADKSIALVDLALRRRFEFEAMYPNSDIILEFGKNENEGKKDFLDAINKQLIKDKGVDFQIGHAYFLKGNTLSDVINKNILPLLVEYFRNDLQKVKSFMAKIGYDIDDNHLETKGLLKYGN